MVLFKQGNEMNSVIDLKGPRGGGERGAGRKGNRLFSPVTRLRGVLLTWACMPLAKPAGRRPRSRPGANSGGGRCRTGSWRGRALPGLLTPPPSSARQSTLQSPSRPGYRPSQTGPTPPGRWRAESASRDGWPALPLSVPY